MVLFHLCERLGYGPLGVTGLSMGGHVRRIAFFYHAFTGVNLFARKRGVIVNIFTTPYFIRYATCHITYHRADGIRYVIIYLCRDERVYEETSNVK